MRLSLVGHDYKYAAEQMMLTLFPTERPLYGEEVGPSSLSAQISLSHGGRYSTAVTKFYYGGNCYRGVARAQSPDREDSLLRDRTMQKIIKLSFYRAVHTATGKRPHWGALTGIRPGKLASSLIEAGHSPARVQNILESQYYVSPQRAALCMDTAKAALTAKAGLHPARDVCLYVGIPFCPTRCAYCSFVSNAVERSMHLVEPFLSALYREIEATAEVVRGLGLRVRALYIGGGTPTTLSAEQLGRLTGELRRQFNLSHLTEYTVEAGRPDTVDFEKLTILRQAGVNRISINPQSMAHHVLEAMGRNHSPEDILRAMEEVRRVDFPSVNMDIIAGLPADCPDGFFKTLDQVLQFQAENITVHTLSLKKGSKIMTESPALPTEEAVGEMLDGAMPALRRGGYVPYYLYRQKFIAGGFENVGWCKPGRESLYNIAIMEELVSILSLGGGGSTKLAAPKTGRIQRIFNAKYPYEYLKGIDTILQSKGEIEAFYQREVF